LKKIFKEAMTMIILTESPLVYDMDGVEQEPLSHDCGSGHTLRYFVVDNEKIVMFGPAGFGECPACKEFLNS
jgi:hypothetical protein